MLKNANTPNMDRKAIVWFRNDLRIHDNEALHHALSVAEHIIPVYVFDERVFRGRTRFGFRKTGVHRAQFYLDAIHDLRKNLRAIGSELVVRTGKPEEVIYEIAREQRSSWVICNRERTAEEEAVQDKLERNLWSIGQEMIYTRGKMLYYTQDLPFPVTQTPDIFTSFRKEIEKVVQVREPLDPVAQLTAACPGFPEPGMIPDLAAFGFKEEEIPQAFLFSGGETSALDRLNYYIWESGLIRNYKETRNGLLGPDYSSKFSPFLAAGCLSPKKIYWEIKRYENEFGANESTYWMIFELMWRDFFRLMAKKYQNRIFHKKGTRGKQVPEWSEDRMLFSRWASGNTGVPFIDANMRELNQTGFMSNRGRQNAASFLVKDLHLNWQMGAEYFESLLVDYDPCSNWGNWNYIAGVGADPRNDRYFNILSQARRYDPDGTFTRHWLPELSRIPGDKVHCPESCEPSELLEWGVELGKDYPESIVDFCKWA